MAREKFGVQTSRNAHLNQPMETPNMFFFFLFSFSLQPLNSENSSMSAESSSATPAATAAGKGTSGGVPKSKGHQYHVTATTTGYTVTWDDKSFTVGKNIPMLRAVDLPMNVVHQALADAYTAIQDQIGGIYDKLDKIVAPTANAVRLEHLLRQELKGKTDMVALLLCRMCMLQSEASIVNAQQSKETQRIEMSSEGAKHAKDLHMEKLQEEATTIEYLKWRRRFQLICETFKITEESQRLALIIQNVEGGLFLEVGGCKNEESVFTILDILFKATNSIQTIEEYIRTITQQKGESVRSYFFRIDEAFHLFPQLPDEVRMKVTFHAGLLPHIRKDVTVRQKAIEGEYQDLYEAALQAETTAENTVEMVRSEAERKGVTVAQLLAVTETEKRITEEETALVAQKKTQARTTQKFCKFCRRKGHTIRECWKLKRLLEEEPATTETTVRRAQPKSKSHTSQTPMDIGATIDEHYYFGVAPVGKKRGACVWTVDVSIKGAKVEALIDTGASISVVAEKLVSRLLLKKEKSLMRIRGIDGRYIPNRGEVSVMFEVVRDGVTRTITTRCVCIPDPPFELVLGLPTINEVIPEMKTIEKSFQMNKEVVTATRTICEVDTNEHSETTKEVQDIIARYKGTLIIPHGQLPPPERHYRGEIFSLGLTEAGRAMTIHKKQYPVKPGMMPFFYKTLAPFVQAGIFEETHSPHNIPVSLVLKKAATETSEATFRAVLDCRKLNEHCKAEAGQQLSIMDKLKSIGPFKFVTTCDITAAFYSLVLREEDREFTACSPPGMKRLQLTRVPMGGKNSMAALEKAMAVTLEGLLGECVIMHADDLCIFSKTKEQHLIDIQRVFERLDKAGFTLDESKIRWMATEVDWLGFKVTQEGITVASNKAEEIKKMKFPHNVKEVRSVLGLFSFYRAMIPHFAQIAKPLTRMLRKGARFAENRETHKAFERLRNSICSAPILSNGDFKRPMELHCDGSSAGMAGILVQRDSEGRPHLIECVSRTAKPHEERYPSCKMEVAAIVWAVSRLKHMLSILPKVTIYTDNTAALFIKNKEDEMTPLLQRWLQQLEPLNYEIHYKKGATNIADYLSRHSPTKYKDSDMDMEMETAELIAVGQVQSKKTMGKRPIRLTTRAARDILGDRQTLQIRQSSEVQTRAASHPPAGVGEGPSAERPEKQLTEEEIFIRDFHITNAPNWEMMRQLQKEDPQLKRYMVMMTGDINSLNPKPSPQESKEIGNLEFKDGVLFQRSAGKQVAEWRIVIPQKLEAKLWEDTHDARGHCGLERTYEEARRNAWCPKMKQKAKEYVRTCPRCNAHRPDDRNQRQLLAPDTRLGRLNYRCHIDGNTLPITRKGNRCLMVCVDAGTKWITLMACESETARNACKLIAKVMNTQGRMVEVVTDQGTAYNSGEFQAFCRGYGISHKMTAPQQSQSNGMVERVNRTINNYIRHSLPEHAQWDEIIDEMAWTLNTCKSSATQFTPYELVYGREPPSRCPYNDFYGEGDPAPSLYIEDLQNRIRQLEGLSYDNQLGAAEAAKRYYDRARTQHTYHEGQLVRWFQKSREEQSKLAAHWRGPFRIHKRIHENIYQLEDLKGNVIPKEANARDLMDVTGERPQLSGESQA